MARFNVFLISLLCCVPMVHAQYITLQGDRFIDENGIPFYPVMMNYYPDFYSPNAPLPDHPTQADMAMVGFGRYVFYSLNENYDFPVDQGAASILQDFNEIKADGFNTIRLINTVKKKDDEDGFWVKINHYPVPFDNQFVSMGPPYSADPAVNPVCAKYFDMILQICNMANDLGMKVSVEPLIGNALVASTFGDAVNLDHLAFLEAFASFIHQHQVHNLLSYEFWGEPTIVSVTLDEDRPKHVLCELVTSWNETVKAADPDHLTSVGAGYNQDVFRNGWDPMIFPVDFVDIHMYPGPDVYEDVATYKQSMTERYLNYFRFWDRYLKKPYLLNESGFSAEDPYHPPAYTVPNPYLHYPLACWGDEQDQQDFVVNTFLPIRDSRCAGYTWWIFHNGWENDPDIHNTDPTDPAYRSLGKFKERFFGLLRFGGADPNPAPGQTGWEGSRKLVASTFADYAANPPAPAPMAPVPTTLDMNDRYFNPDMHPVNNTTWAGQGATTPWNYGTLTGRVVDQFGVGIAGAVLLGGANVSPGFSLDDDADDIYYNYSTFTDDDGYFEIRGKDPFPGLLQRVDPENDDFDTKDGTIQTLEVGAYASRWTGSGWAGEPGSDAFQPNRTYILNSLQYRYDVVLDDIIVWSGETEDYSGLSTLTTEDVTIGGTAELKARYEVHLQPGFEATVGSECHIYTMPLNLSCEEISDAQLRSVEQSQESTLGSQGSTRTEMKELPLDFHFAAPSVQLQVFPNPASNRVKVQLFGSGLKETANWTLMLLNSDGKEVLAQPFNGINCELDMAPLASGAYTVVARSPGRALQQRIVKP